MRKSVCIGKSQEDAFVCKYIDKTFHKILGQRRK